MIVPPSTAKILQNGQNSSVGITVLIHTALYIGGESMAQNQRMAEVERNLLPSSSLNP